jgi:transcriptional regulator GlxA family with amidase domain
MNCANQANNQQHLHFVVLAVDGSITSAVFAPQEILHSAIAIQGSLGMPDPVTITFEVLSPEGDSFMASCGRCMPTDGALKDVPEGSVIFFPGFGIIPHEDLSGKLEDYRFLGEWLKAQHARGCTLCAGCNGNFLFAEVGLARNCSLTTSWLYAEMFKERYPDVALDLNSILLEHDRVISVGGILCGLDLMLMVLEKFVSQEVARLCTKFMLLDNRQPSKVPFEKRQTVFNHDPLIDKAVKWIKQNMHQRISLNDIAAQVPSSKRNLTRRFREATGESPAEFVQRMRIERAKSLLETSNMPIDQILEKIGYTDNSAFSRQFRNHTMMTPKEYRDRFRIQMVNNG